MTISQETRDKSQLMRFFAQRLMHLTQLLRDVSGLSPQGVDLLQHCLFANYADFRAIVGAEDAELFLRTLKGLK